MPEAGDRCIGIFGQLKMRRSLINLKLCVGYFLFLKYLREIQRQLNLLVL